jgi:ABC-type oligopeptide transport system substrate-binding subunit
MRSTMILAVAVLVAACSPESVSSPDLKTRADIGITRELDPLAPSVFTAVATSDVQGQARSVEFTWTDNTTNETHFQVFGFNSGNGKGKTTTVGANATSATSSWSPGTWTFSVRAAIGVNGDGETVYTDWSNFVILPVCGRKC